MVTPRAEAAGEGGPDTGVAGAASRDIPSRGGDGDAAGIPDRSEDSGPRRGFRIAAGIPDRSEDSGLRIRGRT